MSDKATEIAELLQPAVQALGLELLGVEYLPASGNATLRLYIDVTEAERGTRVVNIEDCEAVSREVSAQLDVEDPISDNYTLEVSSPGVDRPLFSAAHFARFLGEEAKVVLKLPQEGRRRVQGHIVSVEGQAITLAFDNRQLTFSADNLDKARLVPDWVALGMAPQPKKNIGAGKARKSPAAPKKLH